MTLNLPLSASLLFDFTTRLAFGWSRVYPCVGSFSPAKGISSLIFAGNTLAGRGNSCDPVTITARLNSVNAGEKASVSSKKPLFKQLKFVYDLYYLLCSITYNLKLL